MPVQSIPELLKHELGDIYFAEKTILKALKKMTREVSNPDMQRRLEQHYRETEQQIRNLERAFEALGERARGQKCPGILGIVEEHDEFKSEEEPTKPILEAFNLGAGLRVEHYEIAAYSSAIAVARGLGQQQVVDLLQQNLEQEVAMAEFIQRSAPAALEMAQANAEAAAARAASKRGASKRGSATRGASKRGAAKGGAAKRGGARGAAKGGAAKRSSARKGTAKKGGGSRARR